MKNIKLNRILLLVLLICCGWKNVCAQDTTAIIIQQADNYFGKKNYERASYFYRLAQRNNSLIFKEQIEAKLFQSDSMLAHIQPINSPYSYYIRKADSLYHHKNNMLALKEYDKAYTLSTVSEYPRAMIQRIIAEDPSIQKQLMVLHSKKMKSEYDFRMAIASAWVENNRYFKALEEYDKIANQFSDPYALRLKDSISRLIKPQFDAFSQSLAEADNLWMNRDYAHAKVAYRNAASINPDCSICKRRMNYAAAEYHTKTLRANDTLWLMNQLEEAAGNGDFSGALVYLQYLKRENPQNKDYLKRELELERALAGQEAFQEAQALADKADAAFKANQKEEAARYYRLIVQYYPHAESLRDYATMKLEEIDTQK